MHKQPSFAISKTIFTAMTKTIFTTITKTTNYHINALQEENVNVEEMASVEDKHSGLTSKNVAGYNAVKAVNGAAGHATSTPAQAVLASFGSDQAPAPLPPTTINKPFLRSSAFGKDVFGNKGFVNDGFGKYVFGNEGFGHDGFGNNGFGHDGFGHDGFGQE